MWAQEEEIRALSEKRRILSTQLKGLEEMRLIREKDLRESHLNESWWWKLRCDEKNELIQILARRIVHLSATDSQGSWALDGICQELQKVGGSYAGSGRVPVGREGEDVPLDAASLLNYFQAERTRILVILFHLSKIPLWTFSFSSLYPISLGGKLDWPPFSPFRSL